MDVRQLITIVVLAGVLGNALGRSIPGARKKIEYKRPTKKVVVTPEENALLERLRAELGAFTNGIEVIHKRSTENGDLDEVAYAEEYIDNTGKREIRMIAPGNRPGKQPVKEDIDDEDCSDSEDDDSSSES